MREVIGERRFPEMLREQIENLGASCARFDDGALSEAPRIAVIARVLIYDTGGSSPSRPEGFGQAALNDAGDLGQSPAGSARPRP